MRKLKQFSPLVIHDFEEKVFHMENHTHTYFEMGYIYWGSGTHYLNNSRIEYQAGDLFFICPEDSHTFQITKSTRFVFIKFTDSYFDIFHSALKEPSHNGEAVTLMRSKHLKEKKLITGHPQNHILKNIIDNIVFYGEKDNIGTSSIVFYQIMSIISLAKECLTKMGTHLITKDTGQEQLISYLHDHIYQPGNLQVKNIADHFNISVNYFSAYFKRTYGIGFSDYVANYKTSLIEMRMQSKQFTLKQIADEFGFTDESHLSRYFKKHRQMSPGAYRKQ